MFFLNGRLRQVLLYVIFFYFHELCMRAVKTGETAIKRRLAWASATRGCNMYQKPICWYNCYFSWSINKVTAFPKYLKLQCCIHFSYSWASTCMKFGFLSHRRAVNAHVTLPRGLTKALVLRIHNVWMSMMLCLFVWFDSASTIFQLNRDESSWVEPVLSYDKCVLLKDHNAVTPVRLEPAASRSRVKHSTTKPLRSHECRWRLRTKFRHIVLLDATI